MDPHETPARQDDVTPPAPAAEALTSEDSPTIGQWLRQNGTTILIILIGLALLYRALGPAGMWNIFLVAVGLGLVIFIHELGHFLVAKWCDVHVDTFSIGFGPPLPGCKFKRGETTYMIAVFPLGGYVKMIGESPEGEEEDNDPRSFRNKRVWQRMAIISAGVFMNVVLGCICFMIVYLHGIEEQPGTVGIVDAGAPGWQKGIQSGYEFKKIDTTENPTFEKLMMVVALSDEKPVDVTFGPPGGPYTATTIEPRKIGDGLRPRIGFSPPNSLTLPPERAKKYDDKPVAEDSPAGRASSPGFDWGDTIIGMTDPKDPKQITELGNDPRYKTPKPDYFEYYRRMKDLAGKPVTVRVRRHKVNPQDAEVTADIVVEPAFHSNLGLRMKMGHIVAVREGSAAQTSIQPRNNVKNQEYEGDSIKEVEVTNPDGATYTRWVSTRSTSPLPGVMERDLDPLRLPFELHEWADKTARAPGADRTVRLTVIGKVGKEQKAKDPVELPWDDGFRYDQEVPLSVSAMALPALGIAYHVTTTVEGVAPGAPAEKATLADSGERFEFKKNDVITHICYYRKDKKTGALAPSTKTKWFFITSNAWNEVKPNEWATQFYIFQRQEGPKHLLLRVERGNGGEVQEVLIVAEPDNEWPMVNRGFRFMPQTQLHRAGDLGEAMSLGFGKAFYYVKQIYRQLSALLTGKLPLKNMSGPIGIANTAYLAADTDVWTLILFLGIISVNLAVVNFLPIPILDGGHMVFLIYEWLRGKPASQAILAIANYTGLFLIASLMLFVIFLDIQRLM